MRLNMFEVTTGSILTHGIPDRLGCHGFCEGLLPPIGKRGKDIWTLYRPRCQPCLDCGVGLLTEVSTSGLDLILANDHEQELSIALLDLVLFEAGQLPRSQARCGQRMQQLRVAQASKDDGPW